MASGNWWRAGCGILGRYAVMATVGLGIATAGGPAAAADNPPDSKPQTQVDASKGGFTVRSGDNSLSFGVYLQARGFLDDREQYDGDAKGTLGFGVDDGVVPSFDVSRVRLGVRGTMFKPWVKYLVSVEAARTSGESDNKVKDAYLELGKEPLSVRAGQYKVPFGLQELVPDWGQQLVDRSVATAAFAPSRDTGVMVAGTAKARKLGYAIGAFNGSGEARRQNNSAVMWALRLWADPRGEYKLTEGAVDGPESGVFHAGLALRGGDLTKGGRAGVLQYPDGAVAAGLELAWKRRRASLVAEGFWQREQFTNPQNGPDVDSLGGHLQAGYVVLARRLELAARYALVDGNRDLDNARTTELRGGVNHYWKGHNLKLQTDVGRLEYEAAGPGRGSRLGPATGHEVVDLQWRLQLQLYF